MAQSKTEILLLDLQRDIAHNTNQLALVTDQLGALLERMGSMATDFASLKHALDEFRDLVRQAVEEIKRLRQQLAEGGAPPPADLQSMQDQLTQGSDELHDLLTTPGPAPAPGPAPGPAPAPPPPAPQAAPRANQGESIHQQAARISGRGGQRPA